MILADTPVSPHLLLAIVGGFLVFGSLLWFGITGFFGAVSWKPLQRQFPADRWPAFGEGERFGMQSARIGWTNYNGVLNTVLTDEGLYLQPFKMFAFNHPPMFIPWEAVERTEPTIMGTRLVLMGGGSIVGYWGLSKLMRERFGTTPG